MLFSSKRFDESIGLSYFGARCYDAFIGRFISRDPIGYIDGANQYIYVANNPLRFIDPFGLENYLVVVPGTTSPVKTNDDNIYIPNWSKGNSKFVQAVAKTFNVTDKHILTFRWSGANIDASRTNAGNRLANMISQIREQDSNANISVVAHSHGGNVAIRATQFGGKIDTLVTLATPVRPDYTLNFKNIGQHLHFYDKDDKIQKFGGNFIKTPEMGYAKQIFSNNKTQNVAVDSGDWRTSHSDIHTEKIWKSQIESNFSVSSKTNNRGASVCP